MLALFAICLVAIIAMTGLVIDGGLTIVQRRDQQNVADAAAMAGAYAFVNTEQHAAAARAGPGQRRGERLCERDRQRRRDRRTSPSNGGVASDRDRHQAAPQLLLRHLRLHQLGREHDRASAMPACPTRSSARCRCCSTRRRSPTARAPGEMSFDEPGTGNEDVPQDEKRSSTGPCTAPAATATPVQRRLEHGQGPHPPQRRLHGDRASTTTSARSTRAPTRRCSAPSPTASARSSRSRSSTTTATSSGWAMFHLTGSVGGSTKQIRGYFVRRSTTRGCTSSRAPASAASTATRSSG